MQTRRIATDGLTQQVLEAGTGPLVLLLHGFPELGISWRAQVQALAEAGFHAVAPDMRGYGGTDRPATARNTSGRIRAQCQATADPQSWPTTTASVSPSARTRSTMSPTRCRIV